LRAALGERERERVAGDRTADKSFGLLAKALVRDYECRA
jgi:hypothetical protein